MSEPAFHSEGLLITVDASNGPKLLAFNLSCRIDCFEFLLLVINWKNKSSWEVNNYAFYWRKSQQCKCKTCVLNGYWNEASESIQSKACWINNDSINFWHGFLQIFLELPPASIESQLNQRLRHRAAVYLWMDRAETLSSFKFQVHSVMIWCLYTLQVNTTTSLAIVYHQKLTTPSLISRIPQLPSLW